MKLSSETASKSKISNIDLINDKGHTRARPHENPKKKIAKFKFQVFFFGPSGYLGKHRKLLPTALERCVWGNGDGSTMPVIQTTVGKIGAAICWENYLPLYRTHLYSKGGWFRVLEYKYTVCMFQVEKM